MSPKARARARARETVERLLVAAAATVIVGVAYLLGIMAGAAASRRRPLSGAEAGARPLRLLVLIPARDEELTLPSALNSIAEMGSFGEPVRVVVVADNCTDATAAVAAAHGAEVLERRASERGKGHAVAWALKRLAEGDHEAVLFMDADCVASPNLGAVLERQLRDGAGAVQARYVVANPTESWTSALRFAAFALINVVRPWGKDAFGLSAGILGTGFAVDRAVLDRHAWDAFTAVEDTEYHLRLLEAGVRVRFAPEATVSSAMPTSLRSSREQHARWERGKLLMLRHWIPRLLARSIRRRDPILMHAALEGALPSQSVLGASSVALALGGTAVHSRRVTSLALAAGVGQVVYVVGGLWLVRAPARVYRALALAPLLVAWKIVVYVRLLVGHGPRAWERASR